MKTKFERCLIEQCSPTLAGIKVGSLFFYSVEENEEIHDLIREWNKRFHEKGIRICLVRHGVSGGLIYVFRHSALMKRLSDSALKSFLDRHGYAGCHDPDTYIGRLRHRFSMEASFPHEIGIFLGYPLHDVQGFIRNKGRNYKSCGFWKVYHAQGQAARLFAQYKKCKIIYKAMFEKGVGALALAVAA